MSTKREPATCDTEAENIQVFSETLKKVMETPKKERGPAGRAIMSAFQVYYDQIGGSAAKAEAKTR